MIAAGIDAGSRTIKVVLMDSRAQQVLGQGLADQGLRQDALAGELYDGVLARCRLKRADVERAIGTGYARAALSMVDQTITEITCHAAGVRHLCPAGADRHRDRRAGQQAHPPRPTGARVHDFAMNDRCAAGTGRFLEVVAARLDMPLEKLGDLAGRSRTARRHQQHVRGLRRDGDHRPARRRAPPARTSSRASQAAIAARVAAMAGRRLAAPVVFTGGVALVGGMAAALGAALRPGRDRLPPAAVHRRAGRGAAGLPRDDDGALA